MTSPGPFDQQPSPQQPYSPQQYPNQQYPDSQQPYAPEQPPYPTQQPQFATPQQPQFATPQPPAQPGYAQQQPQQGQPTSFRTLTLDLKNAPWYGWTFLQPTVTIDGFRYSAGWSRMQYQVPADRPVYVQCHIAYLWEYGRAAATLEPNQNPHLEYTAPSNAWFAGDIGAPGTTTSKGKGLTIGVLCFLGAVIVGSIGLAIISIALAAGSY